MKKTLYIDIHAIQTVPPSCVNRDDTGSPKTAVYGGVERARISSQAWKHDMRQYFRNTFAKDRLGSRTRQVPKMIADAVRELKPALTEEEAMTLAMKTLSYVGIKTDEKKQENSALFFISQQQVKALAELAASEEKNKESYRQAMKNKPSLDIALFGRMAADDPSLNYDASAQVAHAISTHAVETEYDYFTAVDDQKAEDTSGAGHLGTVEFNSSTLYRYATLNITELNANLPENTAEVVRGFVEAFACSMPTGKQNTFANRTLPDLLYITVRKDQPVNLSGAFERAIRNSGDGYVEESCKRLLAYAEKVYGSFAERPVLSLGCGDEAILSGLVDERLPLKTLLERVEKYVLDVCRGDMV